MNYSCMLNWHKIIIENIQFAVYYKSCGLFWIDLSDQLNVDFFSKLYIKTIYL